MKSSWDGLKALRSVSSITRHPVWLETIDFMQFVLFFGDWGQKKLTREGCVYFVSLSSLKPKGWHYSSIIQCDLNIYNNAWNIDFWIKIERLLIDDDDDHYHNQNHEAQTAAAVEERGKVGEPAAGGSL